MKHIKYLICITVIFLSCTKQEQPAVNTMPQAGVMQTLTLSGTGLPGGSSGSADVDPVFENCYKTYITSVNNGTDASTAAQTMIGCMAPSTDKWILGWPAARPGKQYAEAPICYPCIHQVTDISMLLDLLELSDASTQAEIDLARVYLEPMNGIISRGAISAGPGATQEQKRAAVVSYINTLPALPTDVSIFLTRYINILFGQLQVPQNWANKLFCDLVLFTDANGNVSLVKGAPFFLATLRIPVI